MPTTMVSPTRVHQAGYGNHFIVMLKLQMWLVCATSSPYVRMPLGNILAGVSCVVSAMLLIG